MVPQNGIGIGASLMSTVTFIPGLNYFKTLLTKNCLNYFKNRINTVIPPASNIHLVPEQLGLAQGWAVRFKTVLQCDTFIKYGLFGFFFCLVCILLWSPSKGRGKRYIRYLFILSVNFNEYKYMRTVQVDPQL